MATAKEVSNALDRLDERELLLCGRNARGSEMRIKAQRDAAIEALQEVRELIEGYMDVSDGPYGVPVANKAMRAVQRIDEAIAQAQ